jgi:hypothetical protein
MSPPSLRASEPADQTKPQAMRCAREPVEKRCSIRCLRALGDPDALVALVVLAHLTAVATAAERAIAEGYAVMSTHPAVAVKLATAADATEGCTHSDPGRDGWVVENRRRLSAVTDSPCWVQDQDGVQVSSCECSRQPAGRSAELLGADPLKVHERRNVAWLGCAYAQACSRLGCRAPGGRELRAQTGIRH